MNTSTSSAPQSDGLVKDDEFWFDDGNIILISNNGVAFRVYRGFLARISSVFHDMFAISQPDDAEVMDGCVVVRLQDSSYDLRAFIEFVMNIPPR